MKEKVIEYLKAKGIKIDETLLKYLDGGIELTDQDENIHNFKVFPLDHNESWYFNFIDTIRNVYCISRFSFEMGKNRSLILFILGVDGKIHTYFKATPLDEMPANLEFDKHLKYICLKPMKRWKLIFDDKKYGLEVIFNIRFPVFSYSEAEDPRDTLEKYGIEILDVAAQQHYEQAMMASGKIILKKKGETRDIDCFGHRDHSWGMRDWVNIDAWNWVAAQFEDETINLMRSDVLGKNPQMGFISSKKGNIPIETIEVSTKTKDDGETPEASEFRFTDRQGNTRILLSKTRFSMRLPLQSEKGLTEIFEQVADFSCEGKKGVGISEYLMSKRH